MGIAETVAQAMAEAEYSDEVYDKVEKLKVKQRSMVQAVKTIPTNLHKLNKSRIFACITHFSVLFNAERLECRFAYMAKTG